MERNNGVDLFRFIGAFFIILLHTSFGDLEPRYVDNLRLLSRWAVPFYFITSGYFLGLKLKKNNILSFDKIQKNILSLTTVLILTSFIYLPVLLYEGGGEFRIENLLTGSYFHLWFIGSMIFGYSIIWYLFLIHKEKWLPYLSIIILLLSLLANSYEHFIATQIDFSMLRFLLSIPLMAIGIFISKLTVDWARYQFQLIGIVVLGLIIQFAEVAMFEQLFNISRSQHQLLVGTLIAAISLFLVSITINLSDNRFSKWGREHSLFIYLYHLIFFKILSFLVGMLFPDSNGTIRIFSPILTFGISLLVAVFMKHYLTSVYKKLKGDLFVEKSVSEPNCIK